LPAFVWQVAHALSNTGFAVSQALGLIRAAKHVRLEDPTEDSERTGHSCRNAIIIGTGGLMYALTRATLLLSFASTIASADVVVTIDNSKQHQTMQGFGATTLSLVFNAMDNVPPALRTQAIDALYNQVKLNTGNLEVEPFESPASNVYAPANDDSSTTTFGSFNWIQSDNMMQKVVTPGQAFGFDHYWIGPVISTRFALAWAPPLRSSDYQRYLDELAEHVAAVAIHWRDSYRITPDYMQLFNEPLSGNGELAGGSVTEIIDIIKRSGDRLRAEGFVTMKFVVTAEETEAISLRDAQMIMADPDARRYVGAIAYHPYPYGSTYASVPNIGCALEISAASELDALP
jgi:O-glycosyl hydrolase